MFNIIKNWFKPAHREDIYQHRVEFTETMMSGEDCFLGTVLFELYRLNGKRKIKIHAPEYVSMKTAKSATFYTTVASPWLHGNKTILVDFCARAKIRITDSMLKDSII